jgi:outer membrane protein assembly factor BamB
MKIECRAQDLHATIDEAWEREATCPECAGALSEDGTRCWDCCASDYLEENGLIPTNDETA